MQELPNVELFGRQCRRQVQGWGGCNGMRKTCPLRLQPRRGSESREGCGCSGKLTVAERRNFEALLLLVALDGMTGAPRPGGRVHRRP